MQQALSPAKMFTDHMVLQCGMPIPVWGWAAPGVDVEIAFSGQVLNGRANANGRWRVTLAPLDANGTGQLMHICAGEEKLVIRDVLVGEVWFVSGQSNMEYKARHMAANLPEGRMLVEEADLEAVRYRRINDSHASVRSDDLQGGEWVVCTPKTALNCSAVALVFANRIHRELRVPVGIIDLSWGGTPIEPYIPEEAFAGHPTLVALAALAKAGDFEAIKAMRGGTFVRNDAWLAGVIFNGCIAPLAPYAIRGALWYQGESNAGEGQDPRDYAHKMRALITGWRQAWAREDLPVYFVQLPQWDSYEWPYLREEQLRTLAVENVGMAVTIDLDNANDIHPPNKVDVGERLALWPLAKVYGRRVAFSGPLYKGSEIVEHRITVTFDYTGDGLMTGHLQGVGRVVETKGSLLNGFEIIGSEGAWREAT
ncbi:MAG: sialate O-acetylesterase, partial [Verrucomicrobia bacterium]|nr:sialate O-acetylesterase [Verrucomicrobiota bacterium]